jgi:DNA-directed RNA polymerase specialized sigma24 family protein
MSASSPEPESGSLRHRASFPVTHWSAVLSAGIPGSPEATAALEVLCRAYWYPLYAYLRRRGHAVEDAKDLTQTFLARLSQRDFFAHADPGKGKFRSFLLAALNHFLTDEWRQAHAAKRGGGQFLFSLDEGAAEGRHRNEPFTDHPPETIYERRWALTLLEHAKEKLRREWDAAGKARQFALFMDILSQEAPPGDCAAAGAQLGMSAGAVAVAVHRLRERYGQLIRQEVAHTVNSPAEVEDEIRWLFAVVA